MNAVGERKILLSEKDTDETVVVARAVSAARAAQSRWSQMPLPSRLKLVRELRWLMAESASELAEASASARQRLALESLTAEVFPLAESCRFLEREAVKILSPRHLGRRGRPLWLADVRSKIYREPVGVVLIIGPGNYPLLLPGVQLIQALAAGNAVLLKPGVNGTAAARLLCELLVRAGFDSQLVSLLPESAEYARAAIAARPDKVLFTGSAVTGEKILAQLAPCLVSATMELSGCDAMYLRADADLDLAVRALTFGLTLNGGATCMSPRRVFVHSQLVAELETRLSRIFNSGSSRSEESRWSQGTVAAFEKAGVTAHLARLFEDAFHRGAQFLTGPSGADVPIVLRKVAPSSRLLREHVPAPVLAIVSVADDDEAIFRMNDCPLALTASIFSRDESAARACAARVNAGVVTINDLIVPTADARIPFGGRRRSGFGVTRGAEGLLELTTPKVVTVSRGKFRPAFDRSQPGDEALFNAYLKLTHGRGFGSRAAALVALAHGLCRRLKSTPTAIS